MRNYQFKMDAPLSCDREYSNYGMIRAYKHKELKDRKEKKQRESEIPIEDQFEEFRKSLEEKHKAWGKKSNYILSSLSPNDTLSTQIKDLCNAREYRNQLAAKKVS
ncbi:unnamed protein product [Blepharisma stoltei]|uniref:Pre-mRNA-splicing factor SYF2 n=1 Tax=Blepharisma stoltei TaxID=1481888 RepID=A0AAU9JW29_9CILI|nr:unnamed protein product [Blepharisma stoltei]